MRLLVAAALCFVCCSCSMFHGTVAPANVQSHAASFDKNTQNSGVVASDSKGFVVSAHFLDRHNIKHGIITDDGVTKLSDGTFLITGELMSRCIEQDQKRRNAPPQ